MVICAGGARLFTCAWVAIGLLRRVLGCSLPIQVWHMGDEEMGPAMRAMLGRFDVEIVDAFEMARFHPVERLAGWELKPYALQNCRFREVLLLDADNMPATDPTFLFDSPEYRDTGALFWPDIIRIRRDNPIWEATGVEPWRGASLESGQMVVDKARCAAPIALAQWMNQNAETFYDMIWGDKDTFLISWLAMAAPFSLIPHAPDQLEGVLCQKGPGGEVLFQHRTNAKWTLRGKVAPVEGFRLHEESVALLAELAREWDGWIFNPPSRSAAARATEVELARQADFTLTRLSLDQKPVTLAANHRIGEGAAADMVYWHVEDGPDAPVLVFSHGGFVGARLTRNEDGMWRGDWRHAPYPPAQLAPRVLTEIAEPEVEPAIAVLLDDLRAAFEARSADVEAVEAFSQAAAAIGRVRPAAIAWLKDLATKTDSSDATRRAAEEALAQVGSRGRRTPARLSLHHVGPDILAYDRD